MPDIKYILFDAANTLIHKPDLWIQLDKVLVSNGFIINRHTLMCNHKLLSELIEFPDQTSQEFYHYFNRELLLSLGIVPNDKILKEIFSNCTYLDWCPFEDTSQLRHIELPIGILSNFNSSLRKIIDDLFGKIFNRIFISEELKVRKPDIHFFLKAIDDLKLKPSNVLYIGDSIKLDLLPAQEIGFQCLLIDRLNLYQKQNFIINDMSEIKKYLN